jgi:uncharacterized protein YcnI
VYLPVSEPGTTIYFPVVQRCEVGNHRWIETPDPADMANELDEPAPGLLLVESD